MELLIHHPSIPHSNISDLGTHFTAKEVQGWALPVELTHGPHHPKAAGQTEQSNGLLKTHS